jgi:hypothetical protein
MSSYWSADSPGTMMDLAQRPCFSALRRMCWRAEAVCNWAWERRQSSASWVSSPQASQTSADWWSPETRRGPPPQKAGSKPRVRARGGSAFGSGVGAPKRAGVAGGAGGSGPPGGSGGRAAGVCPSGGSGGGAAGVCPSGGSGGRAAGVCPCGAGGSGAGAPKRAGVAGGACGSGGGAAGVCPCGAGDTSDGRVLLDIVHRAENRMAEERVGGS